MAIFSKKPRRAQVASTQPVASGQQGSSSGPPSSAPASSAAPVASPPPLLSTPSPFASSSAWASPSQLQPRKTLREERLKVLQVADSMSDTALGQLRTQLDALPPRATPTVPARPLVFASTRPWSRRFRLTAQLMREVRDELVPDVHAALAALGVTAGSLIVAVRAGSARALVPTWFNEQSGDPNLISAREMHGEIVSGHRVPDVLVLDGVTGLSVNPVVIIPVLQAMAAGLIVILVGRHDEVFAAHALLDALLVFRDWAIDAVAYSGPGGFDPGDDGAAVMQLCTAQLAYNDLRKLENLSPPAEWARRITLAYLWRHIDSLVSRQALTASVGVGVGPEGVDEQSDARRWRPTRRPLAQLVREAGEEDIDGDVSDDDVDVESDEEEVKAEHTAGPGPGGQAASAPHPGSRAGMSSVPGVFAPGWGWCSRCRNYRPLVTKGTAMVCTACKAAGPNKPLEVRPVTTADALEPAIARRAIGPCVNPACPYSHEPYPSMLWRDEPDGSTVLRCDGCHSYRQRFGHENPSVDSRRLPVMERGEYR